MPLFQNNPFQPPQLLQKGVPAYLFGSFSQKVGNTRMAVSTVAIASNVATVVAVHIEGPGPAAGDYISIINTTTGSGEFNVNRAIVVSASYSATTNLWTITFALTGSNVSATSDGGTVITEPAEVPETLTNNTFSRAVLVQAPEGDSQFTLPIVVRFPSLPTAATATLQALMKEQNSDEWTAVAAPIAVVAAGAYTTGPFNQVTLQRGYCYRLAITGVTGGTSPTVIARIG